MQNRYELWKTILLLFWSILSSKQLFLIMTSGIFLILFENLLPHFRDKQYQICLLSGSLVKKINHKFCSIFFFSVIRDSNESQVFRTCFNNKVFRYILKHETPINQPQLPNLPSFTAKAPENTHNIFKTQMRPVKIFSQEH